VPHFNGELPGGRGNSKPTLAGVQHDSIGVGWLADSLGFLPARGIEPRSLELSKSERQSSCRGHAEGKALERDCESERIKTAGSAQ
jgi:hypothetical protein